MKLIVLLLRLSWFMALGRPVRWKRRMFHVPKGIAYAVENSRWGTWIAHKLGFHWIDKDFHITADGVPVFGHWGKIRQNGFLLPRWFVKKYGRDAKIGDVQWSDLKQLRTGVIRFMGKRRYRFMPVGDGFRQAAKLGMGIGLEYKGDREARQLTFWESIDRARAAVGLAPDKLVAMTLPDMGGAGAMLVAADAAGVLTMVIRAEQGVPREWAEHIDFYRGRVRWV